MASKNVGYEAVEGYQISDVAVAGTTTYNGYLDKEGNWYIQKVVGDLSSSATMRYARGGDANNISTDYQSAWAGRTSLTYVYFSESF